MTALIGDPAGQTKDKETENVNEVMKFSGGGTGLMSRDDLAKSLNNIATAAPRVGGEFQFLKMEKGTGDWVYGQEETLVEDGSLWAVNPSSLEYGYIAWPPEESKSREPEGEVMVPISRPLPDMGTLRTKNPGGETTGRGWQYQQSVVLACVNGEDEGVQCQYKQSSVGSQKLFKTLVDAIMAQASKGDAIVPIVRLKSTSYKHDKYGKIVNPVWEIVEWRTMDDNAPVEPEAAESEKAAPRTRGAAKAEAAAPAADAEEEQLAAEYAAEQQAASSSEERAPRRRVRR